MKVNGEKIEFKVFDAIKLHQDTLDCFNVYIIQNIVEEVFQVHHIDPIGSTLIMVVNNCTSCARVQFSLGSSESTSISGSEATSCTETVISFKILCWIVIFFFFFYFAFMFVVFLSFAFVVLFVKKSMFAFQFGGMIRAIPSPTSYLISLV